MRLPRTRAQFNCLRLSFSDTGPFPADAIVALQPLYATAKQYTGIFGPRTFLASLFGCSVPVTVAGSYTRSPRRLTLFITTALQGTCIFGTTLHAVRLIDGDNNLHPGDAFPPGGAITARGFPGGDTLLVDVGDGTFTTTVCACYGSPIPVDGAWYQVSLTPDGSALVAVPCREATAFLTINRKHWHALLAGTKYLLDLSGGPEPFAVPADRYRVLLLPESAAPHSQDLATALAAAGITGNGKLCRLSSGTSLTLTPSRVPTASVQVTADDAEIMFTLAGVRGADDVSFAVFDACGNRVYSNSFEHG